MNYKGAWNELECEIRINLDRLIIEALKTKVKDTDLAIVDSLNQVVESMQRIKEKYRKEDKSGL